MYLFVHAHIAILAFICRFERSICCASSLPQCTKTDEEYMVAIDPGVHRFGTTYLPEGDVVICGSHTTQVVDKLLKRIDRRKYYEFLAHKRLKVGK